jgi:hypothetical protein
MRSKWFLAASVPVLLACLGWVQSTRPSNEKPAELTLVILSYNKTPASGVPVVLIDNSVETVYKSAGVRPLSRKPGDVVAKGTSNEKGELPVAKIKAGTYAYEVGDPEKWGYANGQIEIKDADKPKRVEITLTKPVN